MFSELIEVTNLVVLFFIFLISLIMGYYMGYDEGYNDGYNEAIEENDKINKNNKHETRAHFIDLD